MYNVHICVKIMYSLFHAVSTMGLFYYAINSVKSIYIIYKHKTKPLVTNDQNYSVFSFITLLSTTIF